MLISKQLHCDCNNASDREKRQERLEAALERWNTAKRRGIGDLRKAERMKNRSEALDRLEEQALKKPRTHSSTAKRVKHAGRLPGTSGRAREGDEAVPYFQPQDQTAARCGMHALNNVLGMEVLDAEQMSEACDSFLWENHFEGGSEVREDHETPGTGFYSEAVMTYALRRTRIWKMDVDRPVLPDDNDEAHRIDADDVMGVIINQRQRHWIAVRNTRTTSGS